MAVKTLTTLLRFTFPCREGSKHRSCSFPIVVRGGDLRHRSRPPTGAAAGATQLLSSSSWPPCGGLFERLSSHCERNCSKIYCAAIRSNDPPGLRRYDERATRQFEFPEDHWFRSGRAVFTSTKAVRRVHFFTAWSQKEIRGKSTACGQCRVHRRDLTSLDCISNPVAEVSARRDFSAKEGRFPNRSPLDGGLETTAPCQQTAATAVSSLGEGRYCRRSVLLRVLPTAPERERILRA